MIHRQSWLMLECVAIGLCCTACRLPTELKPTFSLSNEILVFDSTMQPIERFSGLPGIPADMEVLPNGHVLAAVDGAGLMYIDPTLGRTSSFFGPVSIADVDILSGTAINNLTPSFLTVSEKETAARFLDAGGQTIHTLAVPLGTRAVSWLENKRLLIVHAPSNRLLEITETGETVWESTIPLRQPFDAIHTLQDTFLIADFDHHRIVEIDRQNNILAEGRGFNHPRRLQLLSDGNILAADSDLRRITALARPNLVFPIVEELNRPHSLAYDEIHQRLFVGIEPHFRPGPGDLIPNPSPARKQFILVGFIGTFLLTTVCFLYIRYATSIREIGRHCLTGIQRKRDILQWPFLTVGIVTSMIACGLLAMKYIAWGWGTAAVGILITLLARHPDCLNPHYNDPASLLSPPVRTIRYPYLVWMGLLLFWWAFLWACLQPLSFWPLIPWLAAPVFCAWSFQVKLRDREGSRFPWLPAILLLAAFFRFYRIDEIPCGLWLDEVFVFWCALSEYTNQTLAPFHATPLFDTSTFDIPNLYLVATVLASKLFGASFLLIKCFSIVPSLVIVAGVYYLGKWTWGPWVGRLGALLLAVNAWQVTFARWGWLQQAYVGLAIFALAFFFRSYRWKCPRSAAWAGIILGFGFYTYIPILIATATIALLFLISLIETSRRESLKLMLILSLHTVLVFAPLWDYFLTRPGIFGSRAKTVSIVPEIYQSGSFKPLLNNLSKYAAMLHVQGDYNPRHNIPNKPLLDPLTGGLVLVGLALALRRFYRPPERTLLLALLLALAGGVFSATNEAPNSFRTGVFGPLICLTAGIPLAALLDLRRQNETHPPSKKRWIFALISLALVSITSWNAYRYFIQFPSPDTWIGTFGAVQHHIYCALTPGDLGSERLFIHPSFTNLTLRVYTYFLEEKQNPHQANIFNQRYLAVDIKKGQPPLTPGINVFVMPPDYEDWLRTNYPSMELTIIKNPYDAPVAILGKLNHINNNDPIEPENERE